VKVIIASQKGSKTLLIQGVQQFYCYSIFFSYWKTGVCVFYGIEVFFWSPIKLPGGRAFRSNLKGRLWIKIDIKIRVILYLMGL